MIKLLTTTFLILIFIVTTHCQLDESPIAVKFGVQVLIEKHLDKVRNKRIGIVTNQTGVLPNGVSIIDTLVSLDVNVTAIFGLEHGFRSNNAAGEKINDYIDDRTGIPVYSLYGWDKKPTKEMLSNVDVILFDVQDIGARFYTYISTLFYVLQSVTENGIKVIVLDRPNPISGTYIDGPMLDTNYTSFIGIAPLPVTHGLTLGELANLFVEENYIFTKEKPDLEIIKCEGWDRNYFWDDFSNTWIPTSPNIPKFETALVYPGTCLIEGTNISEGRGTDSPFLKIGAPFINSSELIDELKSEEIDGVEINPVSFIPKDIPGKSINTKFSDVKCNGVNIRVTNKKIFKSVQFGIYLLSALTKLYPDKFKFNNNRFDLLAGNSKLRYELKAGIDPALIVKNWQKDLSEFESIRKKYLLY